MASLFKGGTSSTALCFAFPRKDGCSSNPLQAVGSAKQLSICSTPLQQWGVKLCALFLTAMDPYKWLAGEKCTPFKLISFCNTESRKHLSSNVAAAQRVFLKLLLCVVALFPAMLWLLLPQNSTQSINVTVWHAIPFCISGNVVAEILLTISSTSCYCKK